MTKTTYRSIRFFLTLVTFIVFFSSIYFQYVLNLVPCPLCLMQRICVFLLLVLMGFSLKSLKRAHIISLLQVLISCAGLFFSLRQVWLQNLPSGDVPACMPGLDILVQYFPWQTVAKALFWGAGDCAESTWSMFGITMAGWSAMYFLFMALSGLFLFYKTRLLAENID